jgi:hypothetical protein
MRLETSLAGSCCRVVMSFPANLAENIITTWLLWAVMSFSSYR